VSGELNLSKKNNSAVSPSARRYNTRASAKWNSLWREVRIAQRWKINVGDTGYPAEGKLQRLKKPNFTSKCGQKLWRMESGGTDANLKEARKIEGEEGLLKRYWGLLHDKNRKIVMEEVDRGTLGGEKKKKRTY